MCKIIVCSGRNLILGGKNVHPSFAYSSCSTHIVLYHIYDIDYVYRIYYMMHAAVYLVVERSQPPHAPHAHYTWAASTPPTPSQCGPSGQSVTKSRRPSQLSGTSGPSPVFPTFPTPVIWATRGYWTCFFCQENRSPPKSILTMKLQDSTAWYCDVWYQLLCDVEYCERISNIRLCVILKYF